jgi:hypothetical protein
MKLRGLSQSDADGTTERTEDTETKQTIRKDFVVHTPFCFIFHHEEYEGLEAAISWLHGFLLKPRVF